VRIESTGHDDDWFNSTGLQSGGRAVGTGSARYRASTHLGEDDLEIPDALLGRVKTRAVNEGTTIRALVEEGLRRMIAVDSNILVYAHREDSAFHRAAARCISQLAEGVSPWAIPWPCIHEFIAIVTHPRRYAPPTPAEAALEQVDAWMESPGLVMLGETSQHWSVVRKAVRAGRIAGGWFMTRASLPCASRTESTSC
jgi:predicted nucleic acid-binding protein